MDKERINTPRLLKAVYERPGLTLALKILSHIICIYAIMLFALLMYSCLRTGLAELFVAVMSLGAPFAMVSLIRRVIDIPRPYEVYDIYEIPPKDKRGCSFPSRHVFSAFLIGTSALGAYPLLGALLLLLGAVLSFCRVVLGIHFIRDCVAGGLIGAVCGAMTLILL